MHDSPEIDIRPPTTAECPAAGACQITSWVESYATFVPPHVLAAFAADLLNRIANWHSRISRPELTTLLACTREDNRVVDFVTADRVANTAGRKKLHSVYVLEPWQGKGIGKQLMAGVLGGNDTAAEVWLFEGNADARKWYERQGFGREVRGRQFNEGVERWEMMLVRE